MILPDTLMGFVPFVFFVDQKAVCAVVATKFDASDDCPPIPPYFLTFPAPLCYKYPLFYEGYAALKPGV